MTERGSNSTVQQYSASLWFPADVIFIARFQSSRGNITRELAQPRPGQRKQENKKSDKFNDFF